MSNCLFLTIQWQNKSCSYKISLLRLQIQRQDGFFVTLSPLSQLWFPNSPLAAQISVWEPNGPNNCWSTRAAVRKTHLKHPI